MRKVLVVVAHCDDELLGCGCYIDKLIAEGNEVSICCMTYYAPTREEDIQQKMVEIHGEIGIKKTYVAPFVALSLRDGSQHIDRVQFVEKAIKETGCDTVITHSKNDLHEDHVETHKITMEAIRIYQRRSAKNKIKKVLTIEIPCASLWGEERFNPKMFVETDLDAVKRKVERVGRYDDVIRMHPHPRSIENITALAQVRGAQCGCDYAEAFEVMFELED